jgi:hypothetical protein
VLGNREYGLGDFEAKVAVVIVERTAAGLTRG